MLAGLPERKKRILLVDDDKTIHIATKHLLKSFYDCFSAYNGDEAVLVLKKEKMDMVLMDLHMRREEEGLEYISILKEIDPDLDIVMVSGSTELDLARKAIQKGASFYLVKDFSEEQLWMTLESVFARRALLSRDEHYQKDRKRTLDKKKIIGNSPSIKKLLQDIEKVRRTKANVIITAETGSGKELVARHIGMVDGSAFVSVDSATITNSMAESILFGHEKGAFTGALAPAKGLFEEATGGTIYFDEIANMSLDIQAKLLRVVQEKEVKRLGSSKTIPLDFRVICATNKDLEKMTKDAQFKHDLYERLNVIQLRIPPLRERKEDIPLLIEHFLEQFRIENGIFDSPTSVSPAALELLQNYNWPGNIRELSNLLANLCTMSSGQAVIEAEDLPGRFREQSYQQQGSTTQAQASSVESIAQAFSGEGEIDFYGYMHDLEGKVLQKLFSIYGGNISQMSKKLKISRSHLYSKLHNHGIH